MLAVLNVPVIGSVLVFTPSVPLGHVTLRSQILYWKDVAPLKSLFGTNRIRFCPSGWLLRTTALSKVGLLILVQLPPPFIETCQKPLAPSAPTTAIPNSWRVTSTSTSPDRAERKIPTSSPNDSLSRTSSSKIVVICGCTSVSNRGASFTGTTLSTILRDSSLNGSVCDCERATRLLPSGIPSLASQATKVIEAFPLKSGLGMNLTRLFCRARRRTAAVIFVSFRIVSHVLPSSILYCHRPFLVSTSVMAIPRMCGKSSSSIRSKAKSSTEIPGLLNWSSRINGLITLTDALNRGESLKGSTHTVVLTGSLFSSQSFAINWTVRQSNTGSSARLS